MYRISLWITNVCFMFATSVMGARVERMGGKTGRLSPLEFRMVWLFLMLFVLYFLCNFRLNLITRTPLIPEFQRAPTASALRYFKVRVLYNFQQSWASKSFFLTSWSWATLMRKLTKLEYKLVYDIFRTSNLVGSWWK